MRRGVLAAAGLFAASLATAAPAAPPDIAFANPPRLVPADRAALEGALPRDSRDAWRDGARRWGDLYVLIVEFTLRAPEGARERRYQSVRIDTRLDGPSVRAVALLPSKVEDFVEEAASAALGRALAHSAGGAVDANPPGTRVGTLESGLGDGTRFHWVYTGGGDAPVPQGSYAVYAVLDVPRRAPRIVGDIAITCATEAETPFFFSPDRSCTADSAARPIGPPRYTQLQFFWKWSPSPFFPAPDFLTRAQRRMVVFLMLVTVTLLAAA